MSLTAPLLNRVRGEFMEMPGLRLRVEQAQRLWNLDRASCEMLLSSLVEAKFLRRYSDEAYGLPSTLWKSTRSGARGEGRGTRAFCFPSPLSLTLLHFVRYRPQHQAQPDPAPVAAAAG